MEYQKPSHSTARVASFNRQLSSKQDIMNTQGYFPVTVCIYVRSAQVTHCDETNHVRLSKIAIRNTTADEKQGHEASGIWRTHACVFVKIPCVACSDSFHAALSQRDREKEHKPLIGAIRAASDSSWPPPPPHSHPPETEQEAPHSYCVRAHWFHRHCLLLICAMTSMCSSLFLLLFLLCPLLCFCFFSPLMHLQNTDHCPLWFLLVVFCSWGRQPLQMAFISVNLM